MPKAIKKNTTPPLWWNRPVKKLGSTRVLSIPIVKIRSPFLATDRGIANKIIRNFRHGVRRSICARTMVVTSNMRLDRMLLHSRATSTFRPGIDSTIPARTFGTPKAENSSSAAIADPRCNNCTIFVKATGGMGTIQKRKQSGKRSVRARLVPKHRTNAAIHKITKAAMPTDNRNSAGNHLVETAVRIPTANKHTPAGTSPDRVEYWDFHSDQINAALIGKMRSM